MVGNGLKGLHRVPTIPSVTLPKEGVKVGSWFGVAW